MRGSDVRDVSDEYGLIAVQGPRALERLGLADGAGVHVRRGRDRRRSTCMVNRTGYTGEARLELLAMADDAGALWDAVLARGAVPCGLGARDTLRLEVCYPLHGNDIGPDTDAISAGLGWVCALDKEFTGADELRRIKERGPRAAARRVRDGGAGGPAPGHADRRGRRGHLRHALADARRRASAWATCPAALAEPGTEIDDRRARHARGARRS